MKALVDEYVQGHVYRHAHGRVYIHVHGHVGIVHCTPGMCADICTGICTAWADMGIGTKQKHVYILSLIAEEDLSGKITTVFLQKSFFYLFLIFEQLII